MEATQEAYIAQEYIDDEVFQSEENSSESRITVENEINPDIVDEEKVKRSKQDDQYTCPYDYYAMWSLHDNPIKFELFK